MPDNLSKEAFGKRKNKRFQCLNSTLQFDNTNLMDFFKQKQHKIAMVNLSTNGIQVVSDKPIKPGKVTKIKISVPWFKPMRIKSKTVWCKVFKRKNGNNYYRVGLKFVNLDKQTENNLIKLRDNPKLRQMNKTSDNTLKKFADSPYRLSQY